MDPFTAMAIMGAIGLVKSEMVDRPAQERQRKLAAKTQELSPWTGMSAGPVADPDTFGTALQFGATGAQMGAAKAQADTNTAIANRLNKGGSLTGSSYNPSLDQSYSSSSFTKPKSVLW